jgi:hypothetical protein
MLSVCDHDRVIRSVYRISCAHDPDRLVESIDDLREGYWSFLGARQPDIPVNRGDDVFISDAETQDRLRGAFLKGALNDLNQEGVVGASYAEAELDSRTQLARTALADLLAMDESFETLFRLVVHSIFVRPSQPGNGALGSHGGSSSAAIGSVWLAMGDRISRLDLVEMYVHELTHHLMFIDELNNPQFNYDLISQERNYALSAILKRQRPLDKVVHSIVVGASLVEARFGFLDSHVATVVHPATPVLRSDICASVESVLELSNLDELVTPHTRHLMLECEEICRSSGSGCD